MLLDATDLKLSLKEALEKNREAPIIYESGLKNTTQSA